MSETAVDLGAYFRRIGYGGDGSPNLKTLQELHRLHAQSIPFENLTSFAGGIVDLGLAPLQEKLVQSRRGGYCFEQNTLLWSVLQQLGFEVSGLSARVQWGASHGLRTPRGHMLLKIDLPEGAWLADVGFGGLTFTAPLQLDSDQEQRTPHEALRVRLSEGEYGIEALLQDEWVPLYAFDLQRQFSRDYDAPNWYTCTHPASIFRTSLRLGRPVAGGERHALLDNRYTHYVNGRAQEIRRIDSPRELQRLIATAFDIDIPATPGLQEKLAALTVSASV